MILPKSQYPKYLKPFKMIKGISYGKCKFGYDLDIAHAHCAKLQNEFGWICLDYKSRIRNRYILLHEIAHLIAGYKNSHNDRWRRACLRIGGTIEEFPITKNLSSASCEKKSKSK